jgi:hypothetical protein
MIKTKLFRIALGIAVYVGIVGINPVYSLSAEIEADRLILAAEEKLSAQDYEAAKQYLARVDALKVTPLPKFYYLSGEISFHYGDLSKASDLLSEYVELAHREGDFYEDALRKITLIEEQLQSQEAVSKSREQLREIKSGGGIERQDTVGKRYDDKIRSLYIAPTLEQSLVLHINSVLNSYMYIEGKIKNLETSEREEYTVAVQPPSQISVSRKLHKPSSNGQSQISMSSLDAFGVNPFVTFRCSKVADQCLIKHPVNGSNWLIIANDSVAAEDLATGLTRLIKALQR